MAATHRHRSQSTGDPSPTGGPSSTGSPLFSGLPGTLSSLGLSAQRAFGLDSGVDGGAMASRLRDKQLVSPCRQNFENRRAWVRCCVRASPRPKLVDLGGFEPPTSSMPLRRAPNCATGPRGPIWGVLPSKQAMESMPQTALKDSTSPFRPTSSALSAAKGPGPLNASWN